MKGLRGGLYPRFWPGYTYPEPPSTWPRGGSVGDPMIRPVLRHGILEELPEAEEQLLFRLEGIDQGSFRRFLWFCEYLKGQMSLRGGVGPYTMDLNQDMVYGPNLMVHFFSCRCAL